MTKSVNQLIDFFVPAHYDLALDIDRVGRRFNGAVVIKGQQVGDEIRLHAKDLEITRALVDGVDVKVKKRENDEISLQGANLQKEVTVEIEFAGKIVDGSMHGLYPCYYEHEGEKKELLATQFESHHAREVFPCVDEPAAKAAFDLTLTTEAGVEVLSNMPVKTRKIVEPTTSDTNHTEKYQQVTFEKTPKMSTYLLAFVIGELQKKSAKTKSGVVVNIYATPAQEPNALDFALSTATRCIDFYDEYFGTKYPLPKSDHVALPDFSSGAMENWGLVTYRETALLAAPNVAITSKQYIATVIAHELSHMWFGDLVTMKWWNDLWLNESFASLMEHIATDAIYPKWQMWQSFETGDVVAALRRDALAGVQSVRQDVHHPDEISTLFDSAIVYAKGERLLKMCRAFVGEQAFRAGLKNYFQKFAYQNTEADDLWNCLSEASGVDVASLMTPWLTRSGYPVVKADLVDGKIRLTQERFFSDSQTGDGTVWPIPLFSNDADAPKLLDAREVNFAPNDLKNFRLNVGNNAHFITAFCENLRAKLTYDFADLDETERIATLNQATLLYRAGYSKTTDAIELLARAQGEKSYAVQEIMSSMLSDLARFTEDDAAAETARKKFACELRADLFKELGVKDRAGDDENTLKLRALVAGSQAWNDDAGAIKKLLEIYAANKHDLSKIDGEMRGVALTNAVRNGGRDEFDYLLDIYKTTADADLKQDICGALTSTREPARIDEILNFMDKIDIVKPQDLFYWYAYMLGNRHARAKTWAWVRANWEWIDHTFAGDKSYDYFPRYAGGRLQTRAELDEFDAFFADKKAEPALTRAITVGHTDIAARVEWLERDRDAVLLYL